MPNIRSAQKALRQSLRRRERNLARMRAFRTLTKEYRRLLTADTSAAKEKLSAVYQALDKAAKTVISKNRAARLKSRLARRLGTSN